ncbi:MAG: hypothetical protein OQJ87_11630, partial [Rhodospirillales bacterium]|nr:hypothetical protein [Rhodospirillales bacterium]
MVLLLIPPILKLLFEFKNIILIDVTVNSKRFQSGLEELWKSPANQAGSPCQAAAHRLQKQQIA